MAKDFRQQLGFDFQDTLTLNIKSTTIKWFISLSITQQRHLRQLDVRNSFLHGNLQKTVYLR